MRRSFFSRYWSMGLVILAGFLVAGHGLAQQDGHVAAAPATTAAPPPAAPSAPAPAPPAPPAPAPVPPPAAITEPVTSITGVTVLHRDGTENDAGGLDDVLFISLKPGNAAALRNWAAAKNESVSLFLDGELVKGLNVAPASAADKDVLRVPLVRNAENRATWGTLLGGRIAEPRSVHVRVGLEDGTALSSFRKFSLLPFPRRVDAIEILLPVAGFVALMIWLVRKTTLVRDGMTAGGKPGTYSLSRVQAAWWFANILVAFFWIWAITGEADTITSSMLALLGIGSGTALGGALMAPGKAPAAPAEAKASPSSPAEESEGLGKDLMTDDSGYAFHRFQMLAWTVVLTVLFWSSVLNKLSMPDFDATLLGLMGISSGTYLGFKTKE